MAIDINEFEKAAQRGGIIRSQAGGSEQLRSSSNSLWKRLRGPSSSEKAENQALRVAFAAALEVKYGKAFVDSVAGQLKADSNRPLSAKTVRAMIEAGNQHLQNQPKPDLAPQQSQQNAAALQQEGQGPAISEAAKDLVDHLDAQNAQLVRLQNRDRAKVAILADEEPQKAALNKVIHERAESIAQNQEFKSRLNNGENPEVVKREMVQARVLLVTVDERETMEKAAKLEADKVAANPQGLSAEQQEELNAILNQSFPPLVKPPPTTLPPLPGEGPPALERQNSVRDMLKNKGAVANNPFKLQDDALKAEKEAKPEVAVSDDAQAKHKESTGQAVASHKPSVPAPTPAALKPGKL